MLKDLFKISFRNLSRRRLRSWLTIIGVVIGIAVGELLFWIPLSAGIRKYGLWMPALDLGAILVSAVVICMGCMLIGG